MIWCWNLLINQVVDRIVPYRDNPDFGLPVAVTVIDSGDGNATPFAYEFARRLDKKRWGDWRKVRCIKGAGSETAPELAVTPTTISKDDDGRVIMPTVTLHMVGAHKLKLDVLETLAISDGSPGQWQFPTDFPQDAYEEFFNEPCIDGSFKGNRNGPNESFDLGGYAEAARQMLQPDRPELKWDQSAMPAGKTWTVEQLPLWARPVSLTPVAGEPERPKTIFERFNQLNGDR
jgi:phage terminase large subunit GpA-like protein